MIENLFAFDKSNVHECQDTFRGANNHEYYLGDYTISANATIDVCADRKVIGACSVIYLRSKSSLSFKRSWQHIRQDPTDISVLWFMRRGCIGIAHSSGTCLVQPGDFALTRSTTPFTMRCDTGDEGTLEVLHLVVPTHILRSFMMSDTTACFVVHAGRRTLQIAERMLWDVFHANGHLTSRIEQLLIDNVLSLVGDGVQHEVNVLKERLSLSEKRMRDVLRFVEIHLSDPNLNAAMIASGCGISQRYLSALMHQYGYTFSTLVWNWRLQTARDWLSVASPMDLSIAETAFRIGFKSASHFSRMFKQAYQASPRAFRTAHSITTQSDGSSTSIQYVKVRNSSDAS